MISNFIFLLGMKRKYCEPHTCQFLTFSFAENMLSIYKLNENKNVFGNLLFLLRYQPVCFVISLGIGLLVAVMKKLLWRIRKIIGSRFESCKKLTPLQIYAFFYFLGTAIFCYDGPNVN